jgi:RNA polymerase sigma-70 factor (sigma-E family)
MEPLEPPGGHSYVESASTRVVPAPGSVVDDSFGAFYRREYDRAVRLAWLLTGSRPAAEDVAQDAMAAVYRAFERIESPSAYLRRAVVNTARSWHRDERRHLERATLLARERHTVDARDAELLDAIVRLPYRQRVVIVARYWGGWSEAEIAQSLGCRPGTVKSLASRGLHRLRREVQQ